MSQAIASVIHRQSMPANWPGSLDRLTSCNTQINPAAASSQPITYRQLRKMDFPEFRAEESVISAPASADARRRKETRAFATFASIFTSPSQSYLSRLKHY